ncbi:MAG: rhomboid family intramembrane serine protease [Terricaulis sp.]
MSDTGVTPWRAMTVVVKALTGAFIVAYGLFFIAPETMKLQAEVLLSVIPARFDAASQYRFEAWYEPFGEVLGHVFLHAGPFHLLMNVIAFLQAAPLVAQRLSVARFLTLFFVSAAGGALLFVALHGGADPSVRMVGASGGICGVFAAYFLAVRPTWRHALADPLVRNAIGMFLVINVGLAGVAQAMGWLPIAWDAHLGGFIVGGLAYLVLAPRWRGGGPWGDHARP